MPAVARAFFSLFVPGGLLFVATAVLVNMGLLAKALPALMYSYPYAVAAAGILLGWRFNRSRLVFAILVLAFADRSLLYFAADGSGLKGVGRTVYDVVSILLPLNLGVLAMIRERGVLTWRGMWRLSLILLQVLAVALICRYPQLVAARYLAYSFIDVPFLTRLPIAQPALLAFAVVVLLFTLRFVRRRGPVESGFFWALLASFCALTVGRPGPLATMYFATAGLVLVISVIETSYSMAFHDELTGLPARRAMNEALLKLGSRYTVAMLDIDFFKKFNDRYGHDVGDQVLRMVASKLAKVTGGGKAFRYGGEEFTLVFSGKLADETLSHLERIRKAIEETGFTLRGSDRRRGKPSKVKVSNRTRKKVSVTISIGVAERSERHSSPHQVIKAADKALYRAKRAGRNRVSI